MKKVSFLLAVAFISVAASAQEISLQMTLQNREYIVGEPLVVAFDFLNATRERISCGKNDSPDRFFVEVTKGTDQFDFVQPFNTEPIGGAFTVQGGDNRRIIAELDKWFPLLKEGKYLARGVLVHRGMRYESAKKSFDIVGGIKLQEGYQMFVNRTNLKRTFRLVYWSRNQMERLFLRISDEPGNRVWDTIDLGTLLRTSPVRLDISPEGEVTIVQRASQDAFLRTLVWSLPDNIEIAERNPLIDPDISASQRAKSLYNEMVDDGKEKKSKKPWYKFW
ncbi:MAG: hypothetical protein J5985_02485 [Kiritimatiellae bacterium]|nr:hypothetical protein [Kiritimatiellia bacterium]